MKNIPHFRLKNFIHCSRIEPVYQVIHKTTYLRVTKITGILILQNEYPTPHPGPGLKHTENIELSAELSYNNSLLI